jgi:hypothetical protein
MRFPRVSSQKGSDVAVELEAFDDEREAVGMSRWVWS